MPDKIGDIIQDSKIFPSITYFTVDAASDNIAKPTSDPTIAWVPETGIFKNVAQNCHNTEPIIDDTIPISKTTRFSLKTSTSKIFFRIVSPTFAPSKIAPKLFQDTNMMLAFLLQIGDSRHMS